jgi:small-conductance mechanosensitive channel
MTPQRHLRAEARRGDNVLGFPRSFSDAGAAALDLVYQAADVFRSMEERAHDTEVRAQSLCRSASEKLRLAEMRAETAERAQRELIVNAEHKLQDASRALEQARSRFEAQQDQLTAVEFRAQAAEAEAREAKQALALVEEAIRRRLLCTTMETSRRLTDVA